MGRRPPTSIVGTPASARRRPDVAAKVVPYVTVCAAMVVIWALGGRGYFWPAWVLGLWGVGILMHAWDVFW